MAAAVALRNSPRIGPSSSRTSSPMDSKKNSLTQEDTSRKSSPLQSQASLAESQDATTENPKPASQVTTEPLAPPPRPAPANNTDTPDYFSSSHNGGTHFAHEPNLFDISFGKPSSDTPSKSLLPPVAALASPAIPGAPATAGYDWSNSLRSGPLSPAMLAGPQAGDYFDSGLRGFPTPNESSLRTGLTPGGGGSMFPAPSPNSQALYQQLASGGATPGTLEFHRTAITAAARSKKSQFPTSAPQDHMQPNMDPHAQHDATDAANGLFMLAKGRQANNQFAVPNQPTQPQAIMAKPNQMSQQDAAKRVARNNGSLGSLSGPDMGDSQDSHEESSRPNTRGGRGKKTSKAEAATTSRRKAEPTPKGSNKRSKGNSGAANNVDPKLEPQDDDDDEDMEDSPTHHPDGKKMTDEEKRRNFLERNRVAALKCRQRKKQWLQNLQQKVEIYSQENDNLNTTVAQLHEEIRNLRTLLMGHKDCPVGHAQGIGQFLNGLGDPSAGFGNQHVNPYGMAMANGTGMQGAQR